MYIKHTALNRIWQGGKQSRIPLISARTGRPAASLRGDVLERTITGSKHLLKSSGGEPYALAFETKTLADAEKLGGQLVEVLDRETGNVSRTRLEAYRHYGWDLDWGFGKQRALALEHFVTEVPAHKTKQLQLALFGR